MEPAPPPRHRWLLVGIAVALLALLAFTFVKMLQHAGSDNVTTETGQGPPADRHAGSGGFASA